MGLGVSGYILDTPSAKHLEVVQQTRNRILQMSPVAACHEALLLPQLLVVPWWVEFCSGEQVLPPVYVCMCVGMYGQHDYIIVHISNHRCTCHQVCAV